MAYHTWSHAAVWLKEHYAEPDPAQLQGIVGMVERAFENEVRGRVVVPISSTDSPEAFAQARDICSMRTAALWAQRDNQDEGRDEMAWFPKWLEDKADALVAQLASPHAGAEDRVVAEAPLAYLPEDGLTAAERPAALFKRANIASGTSGHW